MSKCDAIRQRLAEDGPEVATEDADVRRHLEGCKDCTAFLADLEMIESALRDLPDHDAPDAVVTDTLDKVHRATRQAGRRRAPNYVAYGLAASVVIAASLALTLTLMNPVLRMKDGGLTSEETIVAARQQKNRAPMAPPAVVGGSTTVTGPGLQGRGDMTTTEMERFARQQYAEEDAPSTQGAPGSSFQKRQRHAAEATAPSGILDESSNVTGPTSRGFGNKANLEKERQARTKSADEEFRPYGYHADDDREWTIIAQLTDQTGHRESEPKLALKEKADSRFRDMAVGDTKAPVPSNEAPLGKRESRKNVDRLSGDLRTDLPAPAEQAGAELSESEAAPADELNRAIAGQDKDLARGYYEADPATEGTPGVGGLSSRSELAAVGGGLRSAEIDDSRSDARAAHFLDRYESLDGLTFQAPVGYWANTYIPGDPAMRLLLTRLLAWDRSMIGPDPGLERVVRQVGQPFDAPRDAAMAVYLHSDAAYADGPTRMRVQVGLKGAERQGGYRPAMNVGLVVDMTSIADPETGAKVRALLTALERMRQPEDRFSLTVAGPAGGLLVPPAQFRHGPLRVAIDRLFGATTPADPPPADLQMALSIATENVRQGDDPSAILGSSLVLLVTGAVPAGDLSVLERMAHDNAVGGVPLSVISLTPGTDSAAIDRLVAAGQGNRRILQSADGAEALIDRELHAASRAVARAVRLRIRLAPGVKLVDVLGSRRLGEPAAERVREAEQSIDQRLARNLGIDADRGEDEEGIQIVIPNFFAGDSHVVLLDVVAEGPGAIADVTVRYKDVAYLRNGVARAALALGAGRRAAGPLELNVGKNLVAWELARQIDEAAQYLAAGDDDVARVRVAGLRDLIRGLRSSVAGWRADPDLAADEALLDAYLAALASPAAGDAVQRRYLADSLRYAAFRKLQVAAR